MKTTLNLRTLKRLNACENGYEKFKAAHGSKTVTLTEALDSNGWNDIWWYLKKGKLTKKQERDIRLLTCDYAEHVLHIYEGKFPEDSRPRKAIETARAFAIGQCTSEELADAAAAAYGAARAAAYADAYGATAAARAAARAAAYADAYAAAYAAARAAAYADTYAAAYAAARADAYADAYAAAYGATAADAAAERKWQIDKIKELFTAWEKTANKGE